MGGSACWAIMAEYGVTGRGGVCDCPAVGRAVGGAAVQNRCAGPAGGYAAGGGHVVRAPVSSHRCVGCRVWRSRLAYADDEPALAASALARRVAGGDLDSWLGGRAVGCADCGSCALRGRGGSRRRCGDVRDAGERIVARVDSSCVTGGRGGGRVDCDHCADRNFGNRFFPSTHLCGGSVYASGAGIIRLRIRSSSARDAGSAASDWILERDLAIGGARWDGDRQCPAFVRRLE